MSNDAASDRSIEELSDSLYVTGATDGLPIVPPTPDRIEEMLRGTDLPREHVIGTLGNRDDPLTVEKLASNAVMAGAKPIHLPVLEAGARALADPESNSVQFSVSTGGWAYLSIINGPIRRELDIQCGTGAFGPGFRANRVIGRALGMTYRNTTRIHPGEKDMATIGNPFKYSLVAGENEEASEWEPYHVERGFDAEESTFTLAGPNGFVGWTPHKNTAEHVVEGMLYHMPPGMIGAGFADREKHVFSVLCPYNVEELAMAGLSKQDVKEYVCENSAMPAHEFARGKWGDNQIAQLDEGKPLPSMTLRQIQDPEYLQLLCIGGGGRFNATIGPTLGKPVTKAIETPDDWEALLAEYHLDREWVQAAKYYD